MEDPQMLGADAPPCEQYLSTLYERLTCGIAELQQHNKTEDLSDDMICDDPLLIGHPLDVLQCAVTLISSVGTNLKMESNEIQNYHSVLQILVSPILKSVDDLKKAKTDDTVIDNGVIVQACLLLIEETIETMLPIEAPVTMYEVLKRAFIELKAVKWGRSKACIGFSRILSRYSPETVFLAVLTGSDDEMVKSSAQVLADEYRVARFEFLAECSTKEVSRAQLPDVLMHSPFIIRFMASIKAYAPGNKRFNKVFAERMTLVLMNYLAEPECAEGSTYRESGICNQWHIWEALYLIKTVVFPIYTIGLSMVSDETSQNTVVKAIEDINKACLHTIGICVSPMVIDMLIPLMSTDTLALASPVTQALSICLNNYLEWVKYLKNVQVDFPSKKKTLHPRMASEIETFAECAITAHVLCPGNDNLLPLAQRITESVAMSNGLNNDAIKVIYEGIVAVASPMLLVLGELLKRCEVEEIPSEYQKNEHEESNMTLASLQQIKKESMVDVSWTCLNYIFSLMPLRDILTHGMLGESFMLNLLIDLRDDHFVWHSNAWILTRLSATLAKKTLTNSSSEDSHLEKVNGALEWFFLDVLPIIDELEHRGNVKQHELAQDEENKVLSLELKQIKQLYDQCWQLFSAVCSRPSDFDALFNSATAPMFNSVLEKVLRKRGEEQRCLLFGFKLLCDQYAISELSAEHKQLFSTRFFQLFNYLFLLYDAMYKELMASEGQPGLHQTHRQQLRAAFDSSCSRTFDLVTAIAKVIRGPNTLDLLLPKICDLIVKPATINRVWGLLESPTVGWITQLEVSQNGQLTENALESKLRLDTAKLHFYIQALGYLTSPELFRTSFAKWTEIYTWSMNCKLWALEKSDVEAGRYAQMLRYASLHCLEKLFSSMADSEVISIDDVQKHVAGNNAESVNFVKQFLPVLTTLDSEVGTMKRVIPLTAEFLRFSVKLAEHSDATTVEAWKQFFGSTDENQGASALMPVILLGMRSNSKHIRDQSTVLFKKMLSAMERVCGNVFPAVIYLSGATLMVGGQLVAPAALEGFRVLMSQYGGNLNREEKHEVNKTVIIHLKSNKKAIYQQAILYLKECMSTFEPEYISENLSDWVVYSIQNPLSKRDNFVSVIKLFIQKAFCKLDCDRPDFLHVISSNDFYTDEVKRVAKKAIDEHLQEKRGVNKTFVGSRKSGLGRMKTRLGNKRKMQPATEKSITPITTVSAMGAGVIKNPAGIANVAAKKETRTGAKKGSTRPGVKSMKKRMK